MAANFPDHPLISVVMPVYNAERYVAEAINSILVQTYSHFEFIIVDDGSTDGSAGIVCEFAARDARIHPVFSAHGGRARAANAGIALARGELIARMDADDIALPERFAIQLAWMRRTGMDICGGCIKQFGVAHNIWWVPETCAAIRYEMLFRCALFQPTVMLHTEIAKSHPYDEGASFEDYEMWTRLAPLFRVGNVPQVLLKCRSHERQSHIVESSAHREDVRRFRQPYFHALFPEATAEDYTAFARVAEKEAFPDLAQLQQAGEWLARLAQTPDNFLRQWMAARWQSACQRSAQLGLPVYYLYRQIAPQFGISPKPSAPKLWLACALRLKPGSRLEGLLKEIRQVARRSIDFA